MFYFFIIARTKPTVPEPAVLKKKLQLALNIL